MSNWKQDANKRRDNRQSKDNDEPKRVAKKRKNTKRWCKGKEGQEHTFVCMTYAEAKHPPKDDIMGKVCKRYRFLVCTTCGKEVETYYGFEKIKPEWVTK